MEENIKGKIFKSTVIVLVVLFAFIAGSSNSKYKKMKSEIDSYETKIVKLESKNNEYEDLIDSYKKASIEHNKTITEQSEKIASLEESNTNYKSQVKTLKNKVSKLTEDNKSLTAENKVIAEENEDYKNKITVLTNKNEFANLQIIELTKQTEKDAKTIASLNTSLTNKTNTITTLNNKLATANNKVSTLTTTNNTLNEKVTKYDELYTNINKYHIVNNEMDLINAFKEGGNIVLNTNILMTSDAIVNNKYISLDLKGYNLVTTAITLNGSNVEIKDSSKNQTGKVSVFDTNDTLARGIKVEKDSVLKITNGYYEGNGVIQNNAGTLYTIGGVFNSTNADFETDTIKVLENASAYIYGGEFNDKGGITNSGYLFIDGGEYYGNHIVYSLGGTTKINNYSYKGTTTNGHIVWSSGKLDLTEANIGDNTFLVLPLVDNLSTEEITISSEYKLTDDNGTTPTVSVKDEYIKISK